MIAEYYILKMLNNYFQYQLNFSVLENEKRSIGFSMMCNEGFRTRIHKATYVKSSTRSSNISY
jgi:hypothetical protein